MILGTGIDLVDLQRVRRIWERRGNRFADRILAPEEKESAVGITVELLGSRFAAKEACVKALGTGFSGGIGLRDILVLHGKSGRPELVLKGNALEAARKLGVASRHLSLSHERSMAIALVILEASPKT